MGMFAVACMGCDKLAQEYEDLNDDYSKIMVQVRKFPDCCLLLLCRRIYIYLFCSSDVRSFEDEPAAFVWLRFVLFVAFVFRRIGKILRLKLSPLPHLPRLNYHPVVKNNGAAVATAVRAAVAHACGSMSIFSPSSTVVHWYDASVMALQLF